MTLKTGGGVLCGPRGRYVKRLTGGLIKIAGYGVGRLVIWVRLPAGAPAHAGKDPIAHSLYLKHERPEVYAGAYKFLERLLPLRQHPAGPFKREPFPAGRWILRGLGGYRRARKAIRTFVKRARRACQFS
jgi:hypothetical protein